MSSYQCHEGEVCFYCDAVVSPRHEHDHAPIPLRHGGAETVVACLNCHDLKDRLALRNWPAALVMDVADALEQLAASWFAAGNPRIGTKALWERLRWEAGIQTNAADYRLNNNWPAFYSRILLERRPEWSGRILTRTAAADGVVA